MTFNEILFSVATVVRVTSLVTVLCALVAGTVGCQSASSWWNPTTGYEAVGTPALDFDAAKASCEKESEFNDSSGLAHVNWDEFESCMKPKGWVRP